MSLRTHDSPSEYTCLSALEPVAACTIVFAREPAIVQAQTRGRAGAFHATAPQAVAARRAGAAASLLPVKFTTTPITESAHEHFQRQTARTQEWVRVQ
eukprot:2593809-Pleurochrysis_carterae.AAC.2